MNRISIALKISLLMALIGGWAHAQPQSMVIQPGRVAISVNNQGIIGNALSNPYLPSCEFPIGSGGEHLYLGGIWVGARNRDGEVLVSTSAQDANGLGEANLVREFEPATGVTNFRFISNQPASNNYSPDALAPAHMEGVFDDYVVTQDHEPLGIQVTLRALGWASPTFSNFVIFDYTIQNISGTDLEDVYVGFFNDTTVGNTNLFNPYDPMAPRSWNYYDDMNGGWRPGDFVSDPTLWMMYEHDADGDLGLATSWVGCRLLGTTPGVAAPFGKPPVSYNCWRYRRVPQYDDWFEDDENPGTFLPGKYQLMGNGDFDIGVTPDEDYTQPSNRVGLLSTGPFPTLPAGESVRVVFAMVLGTDDADLRESSRLAKYQYDREYLPIISAVDEGLPSGLSVGPAVPNPFNPSTTINFTLAEPGHARITVHDLQGRLVRTLFSEWRPVGQAIAEWDGRDDQGRAVGSGIYFYTLDSRSGTQQGKMTLVR